jgi:hypothetical protein
MTDYRKWQCLIQLPKLPPLAATTGQAVFTANLMGRFLAELISGNRAEMSQLVVAQRRSPKWEPEPAPWLAVRYMQNAFSRIDEAGK